MTEPKPAPVLSFDDVQAPKGGEAIITGYTGPLWCPQLAELSDKRREKELKKYQEKNPGSFISEKVRGSLVLAEAWNRPVYMLDVMARDGVTKVRVKFPEHIALYRKLDWVAEGCDVFVQCDGPAETGKKGNPPMLYTVIPDPKTPRLEKSRALPMKESGNDDAKKPEERQPGDDADADVDFPPT